VATVSALPSAVIDVDKNSDVAKRYPREQDHRSFRSTGGLRPGQSRSGSAPVRSILAVRLTAAQLVVQGAKVEARGPARSLEPAARTEPAAPRQRRKTESAAPRQLAARLRWRDHSNRWHTGEWRDRRNRGATVLGGSPATGGARQRRKTRTGGTAAIARQQRNQQTRWHVRHRRARLERLGAVSMGGSSCGRRSSELGGGPGQRWCSQYGPLGAGGSIAVGGTTDTGAMGRHYGRAQPDTVKQRMLLPRSGGQGDGYPGFALLALLVFAFPASQRERISDTPWPDLEFMARRICANQCPGVQHFFCTRRTRVRMQICACFEP